MVPATNIVVSLNLSTRNLFDPDLETFIELMVRSGELESGQTPVGDQ